MKHNKSIRPGISMVLGMLLCVVLAACGGGGNTSGTNASGSCGSPPKLVKKDHYKVGFSQNASNNPWRLAETASIKAQAQKRGDTLVYADAANSGDKQVSDVQSMIAQKVDVILLAPITEKALVPAVLQARAACIPVILIDRDVDHTLAQPNKDYVTFIGSDFVQQGKRVADWLIQNTGGKAKIIELEGTTGASPAINRKKGFDDEIKTAPGMVLLASQDGDFNRDTGRKVMATLLQAHPDVTAVYAHKVRFLSKQLTSMRTAPNSQTGSLCRICNSPKPTRRRTWLTRSSDVGVSIPGTCSPAWLIADNQPRRRYLPPQPIFAFIACLWTSSVCTSAASEVREK